MRLIIFSLCLLLIPSVIAFGVSPGDINFGLVSPGGYSEASLLISSIYEEPVGVVIKADRDWFVYSKIFVDKNNPANLVLGFEVPDDLSSGSYKGTIDFYFEPDGAVIKGKTAKLLNVISVPYSFTVLREEIKSCIIGGISLTPSETNGAIQFSASIKNTGTVRINPRINLDFEKDYFESWFAEEILPTQTKKIIHSFDHPLPPGIYNLSVVTDCGSSNLTYEVFEANSLSYDGSYEDVEVINLSYAIPLEATFINDGESAVYAKLVGTVYDGETIVALIEGDSLLVSPGERVTLDAYVDLPRTEDYLIRSKVVYEGFSTSEKEIIVDAIEVDSYNYLGIYIIAFIVVLLLILIVYKKR